MSELLLDSHVALWLLNDSPRLGRSARERIEAASKVHVSAASTWELTIKASLGKIELPLGFADALGSAGLVDLPIDRAHSVAITETPLTHRDPFDQLLVAQALSNGLTFLTADQKILDAWDDAVDARL